MQHHQEQQQQQQQQVLYAQAPVDLSRASSHHHQFQSTTPLHQHSDHHHHHRHYQLHQHLHGAPAPLPPTVGGVVYVDGAGRHILVPQAPSPGPSGPPLLYGMHAPPQGAGSYLYPPPPPQQPPQQQPPPQSSGGSNSGAPAYLHFPPQHQQLVNLPNAPHNQGSLGATHHQFFGSWTPHHHVHHHVHHQHQHQHHHQLHRHSEIARMQQNAQPSQSVVRKPVQPPPAPVHALGLKQHCKWIDLPPGARRAVGNHPSGAGGGGGLPPGSNKVFVGQARHETTAAHIALLFESLAQVTPNTIRPAGKGCFITYVDSDDEARRVATTLHRRVLHDHGGVWFADTEDGAAALAAYLSSDDAVAVMQGGGTAVKLPKQTMVVEHQHQHPQHPQQQQQQQQQPPQQQPVA